MAATTTATMLGLNMGGGAHGLRRRQDLARPADAVASWSLEIGHAPPSFQTRCDLCQNVTRPAPLVYRCPAPSIRCSLSPVVVTRSPTVGLAGTFPDGLPEAESVGSDGEKRCEETTSCRAETRTTSPSAPLGMNRNVQVHDSTDLIQSCGNQGHLSTKSYSHPKPPSFRLGVGPEVPPGCRD